MDKINCINCAKVITSAKYLKYDIKVVRDKFKIIFGGVASSNLTETNRLCCECFSTFNSLFNARLEFNSRTGPVSKINKIRYGKPNIKSIASSSRVVNGSSKGLSLADEAEENHYILPFTDDEDSEERGHLSDEVICLSSEDSSNETPGPLIEFQEKFLQLKIKKLPTNPSLISVPVERNGDNIQYCCFECGRFFSSDELLKNHNNIVHTEKIVPSFKCSFCKRKFFHHWFYRNHLDTCHNGIEILFSCILCDKRFKSQKELNDHKATHRRPFKCKYCPQSYEHVNEIKLLREHLIKLHENTTEAKSAAFNEKYSRKETTAHKMLKENGNQQCFECEKIFSNRLGCFVHEIFDHYNEKTCPGCKLDFMCSDDMKKHLEVSGHELNYCTCCDRKFGNVEKLFTHMHRFHGKTTKYLFLCECCGKGYRFFDCLLKHYKTHFRNALPPAHSCKVCGKKFRKNFNLKLHMASKSHKKPTNSHPLNGKAFQCNICKKTFYEQFDLDSHNSKVHEVVDVSVLHKCPEPFCGFTSKSNMGIFCHRRTHFEANKAKTKILKKKNGTEYIEVVKTIVGKSSRDQYKCIECSEIFKTSKHALLHLYTEHSIVIFGFKESDYFSCKSCKKIFISKMALQKHISVDHRKVTLMQFSCHLCQSDEKFNGVDEIRHHFKSAHPDTNEAVYSAKNEERSQEDAKTNQKQLTRSQTDIYCVYCQIIFKSIMETDYHNETVHKAQPVCKLCQHICNDQVAYKNHEATHTEFPCEPCNSNFSSMQDFCTHLQETHVRYPYICEICGTYISTLAVLMKHYHLKHERKMGKEALPPEEPEVVIL